MEELVEKWNPYELCDREAAVWKQGESGELLKLV